MHSTVVCMERKLPVERAWNRDRDRAIMSLDFDAEERARLDRRWVDVLPIERR